MTADLKTSELLLAVLQISGSDPTPVATLVEVAHRFGLTANAVRVTLSRLVKRGLVLGDGAGQYHMAKAADPVRLYVDAWRQGERRVREWSGLWSAMHLPDRPRTRSVRRRSVRALERLGFREARSHLWIRPDCLSDTVAPLQTASAFGLEVEAEPMRIEPTRARSGLWATALWDTHALSAGYHSATQQLADSRDVWDTMDSETRLIHSFHLGRAIIQQLGFDPLLPAPWVDTGARAELTHAMLDYDADARDQWRAALAKVDLVLPGLTPG